MELAVLTMAICLVWGLLVALANSTRGPLSWIAGAYIQIVRNTPLLIQMYHGVFRLLDGRHAAVGLCLRPAGAVHAKRRLCRGDLSRRTAVGQPAAV